MNFLNVNVQCLPENAAEGQPKCSRRRRGLCTTVAAVRSSSLTQTIRRLGDNLQTRQPVSANQPTSASKPTNQPVSQPKDDQPTHQPPQIKQPASLPHLLDIALSPDLLIKFFSRSVKVIEQNLRCGTSLRINLNSFSSSNILQLLLRPPSHCNDILFKQSVRTLKMLKCNSHLSESIVKSIRRFCCQSGAFTLAL